MSAKALATERLLEFLRDPEERVFALKGPWGVGKSHFVRHLLQDLRETGGEHKLLPPYISYASVFGSRSIRDVQDVINGCLEPAKHQTAVKWVRAVAKGAALFQKAVPGLKDLAPSVVDISNAAFWAVAKRYGVLIVLDDLERAHKDLGIEQLLGLASSVTENSRAKVLLIFNEDKLEGDNASILSRYREKTIDAEIGFHPEAREIVREFLEEDFLTDTVVTCMEASGGPNIRLIRRVRRGVRHMREAFTSHQIAIDDADLAQVAKLVWLYHVSPVPLTEKVLRDAVTRPLRNPPVGGTPSEVNEELRELKELITKGGLKPGSLDDAVLAYLRTGRFAEDDLSELAANQMDQKTKVEFDRRLTEAYAPLTNNFLTSETEVIALVESLLDYYVGRIGLNHFQESLKLLKALGRPTQKWWCQYMQGIAPRLSIRECRDYLNHLPDPEVKNIVQKRLDELTANFDAKATLLRIASARSWDREDMERLDAKDAAFYREWFQGEVGDFLEALRYVLQIVSGASKDTVEWRLYHKLLGVMRELAEGSAINRFRLTEFFRIPLENSPATGAPYE